MLARSLAVAGEPYQYETEPTAGIVLATGERWFGTLIRWRPGTRGAWRKVNAVDVHPFDADAVEAVLRVAIERAVRSRSKS
jgi:hypothetical protein